MNNSSDFTTRKFQPEIAFTIINFFLSFAAAHPAGNRLREVSEFGRETFLSHEILMNDNKLCRVQYQFEEEPFDTVPDLITFYVGSGKAISAASGKRDPTFKLTFRLTEVIICLQVPASRTHAIVSVRCRTTQVNTAFHIAQATRASAAP